jgi:hypothetical protein
MSGQNIETTSQKEEGEDNKPKEEQNKEESEDAFIGFSGLKRKRPNLRKKTEDTLSSTEIKQKNIEQENKDKPESGADVSKEDRNKNDIHENKQSDDKKDEREEDDDDENRMEHLIKKPKLHKSVISILFYLMHYI